MTISPLHERRRKRNITVALVLGALALVILLASLPMWQALFGSVGGTG